LCVVQLHRFTHQPPRTPQAALRSHPQGTTLVGNESLPRGMFDGRFHAAHSPRHGRHSLPCIYWRDHNIGDVGQEVCAGQNVLTSVWTKGSPFSLVRFPLTFCVLLLLRTRCPEAFPASLGKQVRRSCKTLPPSRTTQLGSGVSALPSKLFYELVYSRALPTAQLL